MYKKLRKKNKKTWKKEYILWLIIIGWFVLILEGFRFLPGSKYLSEVLPIWIVILNLVLFAVIHTLFVNKKNFSLKGSIIILVGYSFSMIFLRIGYIRFPSITLIIVFGVILVNWVLKEWKANEGKERKKGRP